MPKIVELQTLYKAIGKLPGSDDDGHGHFNIFQIEDMLLPKHRKAAYSRRSFYKITLITGHNKIHYNDMDIEVDGSTLVFTNPSIHYFWEMMSEKQSGYMCVFTEQFLNRFGNVKDYAVFQSAQSAVIPLKQGQISKYTSLFLKMFEELQCSYRYKYDLLRCLLMEIVHEAQKEVPFSDRLFSGSNAAERIATSFAGLLEQQFPIELSYQVLKLKSPSAFASRLNIHVNHLNKALKEITGRTTSQLINERILQEARVLLKSTNWTIAEIAYSLGFSEPNHFSGFFKNYAKINAKNYRLSNND